MRLDPFKTTTTEIGSIYDAISFDLKFSILYLDIHTQETFWAKNDLNITEKNIKQLELTNLISRGENNQEAKKKHAGAHICCFSDENNNDKWVIVNFKYITDDLNITPNLCCFTIYPFDKKIFTDSLFKDFLYALTKNNLEDVLTTRETEILKHICKGKSNKQIAIDLFLSPHTVKTHRVNIGNKLKSTKSSKLAAIGCAMGLLA